MANIITRTITVYTYKVARMNPANNSVEIVRTIQTPIKLGNREWNRLPGKGEFNLPVEESTQLLGMTLLDFYRFSTPLNLDDKDSNPKNIEDTYDITLKPTEKQAI